MKKNQTYILIGAVVLIAALFALGRFTSNSNSAGVWQDTQIACLPSGHQNLAFHIHPNLQIIVDGEAESIPANVGTPPSCMAEVHTHDSTGRLHVESADSTKENTLTLNDFFAVWDRDIAREGYELSASVNGSSVEDPASVVLQDEMNIVLEYESVERNATGTPVSATTSTTTTE